jgi:copper/silver efflux system protein
MPPVEEGTILFMPMTLPGVSIQQAQEIMRRQNAIIAGFPEVESVIGKAGRATTATDPAPLDMFETVINLKPERSGGRADVRRAGRRAGRGDAHAGRDQPLDDADQEPDRHARHRHAHAGRREGLRPRPRRAAADRHRGRGAAAEVPGTRSAVAERGASGFYLDVEIDREAAARYGLNVMDVQDAMMTAVGGTVATQTVEGRERYGVLVRYPRDLRQSAERIAQVRVPVMDGMMQVPLGQLATLRATQGPMVIRPRTRSRSAPSTWTSRAATSAAT